MGRARSRGHLVGRGRDRARGDGEGRLGAKDIAGIGITNQRETTIVWDRVNGKPIHNAIVWQDRRTADACAALRAAGHEAAVAATEPVWCSIRISPRPRSPGCSTMSIGARAAAEKGRLAFGTVDSFLLWRLTGGKVHATDATNASRTLLFDIARGEWDDELAELFAVSARAVAGGARLRGRLRRDAAGAVRRRDPHSAASPATSRRRPSGRAASRPA